MCIVPVFRASKWGPKIYLNAPVSAPSFPPEEQQPLPGAQNEGGKVPSVQAGLAGTEMGQKIDRNVT